MFSLKEALKKSSNEATEEIMHHSTQPPPSMQGSEQSDTDIRRALGEKKWRELFDADRERLEKDRRITST